MSLATESREALRKASSGPLHSFNREHTPGITASWGVGRDHMRGLYNQTGFIAYLVVACKQLELGCLHKLMQNWCNKLPGEMTTRR